MAEYLMGIDAGTGSVRVALFDFRGQNRAYAVAEYGTTYPKNGWAEQSDYEWFEALKKAIPECIKKAGIAADNIAAITCDATTNTLVYLDENDTSVRPPILWMDVRATEEASFIDTIREEYDATKFYKPGFRADTMVPKCMWVKKNEPENWAKTKTIMEFEDWLNWKLTGRKTVSMSVAAFRWNYDDKNGGYPVDFYNAVGLDDVVDKFPEPVLKVGEVVGNISAEAAEIFGLSKKTVVVEGTADCNACMFGVGGVRPNGMTLIGGTSTCLLGLSEEEFHVDGVNGTYPNCMYDGTSLLEGGQTAAGSILTWFKNNLLPAAWMQEAVNRNMNIYDLITEKASEVFVELLKSTKNLLDNCKCKNGCPSCIYSPKCGNDNKPLNKNTTKYIINYLLEQAGDGEKSKKIIEATKKEIKKEKPKKPKIAKVFKPVKKSPKTNPNDILYEEAYDLYAQEDYFQAKDILNDIIAMDSRYADAYALLGKILYNQGDKSGARIFTKKALSLDSANEIASELYFEL